jgi:hypothetical protein
MAVVLAQASASLSIFAGKMASTKLLKGMGLNSTHSCDRKNGGHCLWPINLKWSLTEHGSFLN